MGWFMSSSSLLLLSSPSWSGVSLLAAMSRSASLSCSCQHPCTWSHVERWTTDGGGDKCDSQFTTQLSLSHLCSCSLSFTLARNLLSFLISLIAPWRKTTERACNNYVFLFPPPSPSILSSLCVPASASPQLFCSGTSFYPHDI